MNDRLPSTVLMLRRPCAGEPSVGCRDRSPIAGTTSASRQIPMFDADWGPMATSITWCATPPPGSRRKGRWPEAGGGEPAGSHAGAVLRGERHQRANSTHTVLVYGHLDKATRVFRLARDLGPWTPKIDDGKLYGRGGADDGYAAYAAITAIQALKTPGCRASAHRGPDRDLREESGSYDLLHYIDALQAPPGRRRPGGVPGFGRGQLRPAPGSPTACAAWPAVCSRSKS